MSTLDEYRTFIEIANLGSFTKTAKKLHLSASAISKKLALLEERLGIQLMDRSTRFVALTELGKQFHQDCLRIVQQVDEAENRLQDAKGTPMGKLSISVPRVLLQRPFIRLFNQFSQQHPLITLDLFSVGCHYQSCG